MNPPPLRRSRWPVWLTCLVILLAFAVIGGGCGAYTMVGGYNKAVRFDEGVDGAWSEVENQLTRRNDLIPNIVETVKGYAKHEKELFENIAAARTKYFQAGSRGEKIDAANSMSGLVSRLLVLRETYPQLKANENFMKLQDTLEGTENRLAVARKRYNDMVRLGNTYRKEFFGRFFAGWAGLEESKYLKAPEEAKTAPKVKF